MYLPLSSTRLDLATPTVSRTPSVSTGYKSLKMASAVDLSRHLTNQNVFVFHLPVVWTDQDLKRHFSQCGSVISVRVEKRTNGVSKGYGFVCFNNAEAAQRAVDELSGKMVHGKRLQVSLKKTPEECLDMQVQRIMHKSGKEGSQQSKCSLFVFHLPSHWTDKELYEQFEPFGHLESAKVAKKDDRTSRGYGFVTFTDPASAALAITSMNRAEVGDGKRLKVILKTEQNPPNPQPGSTIFVFHLPNEWCDDDLRQHFGHFGKIIAARVQREENGRSRGFGFVNYERQQCALCAIAGMNGFSASNKFLKVSLKKGEEKFIQPQVGYVPPPPPGRPDARGLAGYGDAFTSQPAAYAYPPHAMFPPNGHGRTVGGSYPQQPMVSPQPLYSQYTNYKASSPTLPHQRLGYASANTQAGSFVTGTSAYSSQASYATGY